VLIAIQVRHANDASEDREEVGAGGRGQEREREAVAGRGEDPVGDEEVEVDVEIDQAVLGENFMAFFTRVEAAEAKLASEPPFMTVYSAK